MTSKPLKLLVCAAVTFTSALTPITASAKKQLDVPPIELYAASQRSSSFNGCMHIFPSRVIPQSLQKVDPRWNSRGLCSDNFAVLHSGLTKTPLVVVEKINKSSLLDAKGEERTDVFFPDPRLPASERSDLKDFAGSGMDRGHLAPAANQPHPNAMAQSFALSNIVPQNPENNRKIWSKLEADTRKYAVRAKGDVFVFSGPIFLKGFQTVGRNKVWVPTHLFKLVHDSSSSKTWAHILPNTADAVIEKPISYDDFVKITGWELLQGK
jgi:endonuclease G